MSWNHRVVRTVVGAGKDLDDRLTIHEVYYENDQPIGFTDEPVAIDTFLLFGFEPHGPTTNEKAIANLRETLTQMLAALDKPVLDGREDSSDFKGWGPADDIVDTVGDSNFPSE